MTIGRIPSVEGGIQPTIVDAKGDLIAGVAADSINRLAVGSNDQVLVADSNTSTGLAWKSYGAQFVAGKNKIINGDFGIWQRGTSFTATNYTADRWRCIINNTVTISQQTFTPGTAPVAGYEGTFFYRLNRTARPTAFGEYVTQKIEDVRTLAGQTVTISFWAKASTAVNLTQIYWEQNFGSGGSTSASGGGFSPSLTTSWQRFTQTWTIASLSGKTIGTGSFLDIVFEFGNAMGTSFSVDIWGVQLEAGSVATPFQTATGTLQGELAACQRYYYRMGGDSVYQTLANGFARSTTTVDAYAIFKATMRTKPSAVDYSTLALFDGVTVRAVTAVTLDNASKDGTNLLCDVASGLTQFRPYALYTNNSTSAYIGFSAEL